MEIKFTNKELDKREIYKHTRAAGISLKNVEDGEVITPAEICIYADTNSKGEEKLITSIVADDGKHYTTDSPYFRDELAYIHDLMSGEEYSIVVRKQVSKGGRTFTTCELV